MVSDFSIMLRVRRYLRYLSLGLQEKIGLCFRGKVILAKVMDHYSVHNYKEALEEFEKLIEVGSKAEVRSGWRTAAECCQRLELSKEETVLFLERFCNVSDLPCLSLQVAKRWQALQDYNKACFWLKETIRMDPHFEDCFERLVGLVRAKGGSSEAVPILQQWQSHNSLNTTVIFRIAKLYQQMEYETQALRLYERLIQLNPKDHLFYKLYIELQYQLNPLVAQKPLKYIETALQLGKNYQYFLWIKISYLYSNKRYQQLFGILVENLKAGKHYIRFYLKFMLAIYYSQKAKEVCAIFQQLASEGPLHIFGKTILAFSYLCLAKIDKYNIIKEDLINKNDDSAQLLFVRGFYECIQLNFEMGISYLQQYLKRDHQAQECINYVIVCCYQKIGKMEQAIRHREDIKLKRYNFDQIKLIEDYHRVGNLIKSQAKIDFCLKEMNKFEVHDKMQLTRVLMNIDRIDEFKQLIDYQNLSSTVDMCKSDMVQYRVTLVEFYYQIGEVQRAYRRLCALVERIKVYKNNANFATTNFNAIVRVIEMCFKFDEYAGAETLLESIGQLYKAEQRCPQLKQWREKIEQHQKNSLTPKP